VGELLLEGRLGLRHLDRLAADLGNPGVGADQPNHVPDAPKDEGDNHDQEEPTDGPGVQGATKRGDHQTNPNRGASGPYTGGRAARPGAAAEGGFQGGAAIWI